MRPLAGKVVVVTRPRASSGEWAAALRARGARVVFAPLIKTVPPRSWRAVDAALRRLGAYDAAVFASANAAEFFLARARKVLPGAPVPPRTIAAVGPEIGRAHV